VILASVSVLRSDFFDGFPCLEPLGIANIVGMPPLRSALERPTTVVEVRDRAAPLDDVSKAIIEQLQQDGRRPYATIAAAVGLSEAAVRQRVSRLVGSGVVQIVAVTNPLQLGFSRQAMIGVRAEGDLDPIVAALTGMDEVDYVVITAGSFDILVEVVCEDDDHLLTVLNQQIRTIPGVRSTESFVYLRLSKQTYSWGTR
jgi:Lrp/AsnC family transcriptional regulator, regulator for asnA, asnC and gidA